MFNPKMTEQETVEISMKQAQQQVDAGAALKRLLQNEDFNNLILIGYFEKEAARVVKLRSAPTQTVDPAEELRAIDAKISGIGQLHQYFLSVDMQANMAEKAVVDNQAYLDSLDEEEEG